MNIAAIDIGTSRIKCAVFTEDGNMLVLKSQRLNRAASPNRQDANVWAQSTEKMLAEVAGDFCIDAVAVTGNMHAFLPVDNNGTPLCDALLWSNNSSCNETDFLNKNYSSILLEKFGNPATPVFTLPKWIMEYKNFEEKSYKLLQSKDFIIQKLTGNFVTDPSDASGTLVMNLKNGSWDKDFLADLKLSVDHLPEIVPSASIAGYVTREAHLKTGLKVGIPVITGAGDLATAAIGSGVDDDTFSLTLGTAGQLLGVGPVGNYHKLAGKIFTFAHASTGKELYLGSVPAGGFCFEWLSRIHNISVDDFFAQAQKSEKWCDLPLFMPYILGRGAPYMDYTPCGAWYDLKAELSLSDLCKGAVLGTLCALRQNADCMENLSGKRSKIVFQALACREEIVRSCAAKLFKQQKFIPQNSEASLLGTTAIALTALKVDSSPENAIARILPRQEIILPHDDIVENYFKKYLFQAENISI